MSLVDFDARVPNTDVEVTVDKNWAVIPCTAKDFKLRRYPATIGSGFSSTFPDDMQTFDANIEG
jgi:hypothetical protein